ncbi:Aspartyl-tRNA(Asn) amidotransferase subunit C [Labilithrix luteola]|uniref:Aspartyl/glutamyl-tRNA(Asn/Gln) amidotransferase subunit C n=1 Tax=Labilithrix luteola TaxID=1391654 RepID=A0A0K1Q8X4_9BACT|nr:Asp-tRNA(Asn)/Glu-tRNA(Gln) amidotransferase subunit GatC [Labilithrix luteola]AKV02188.1 Aspartyl-tRNA(Asn) amidotransferase subunit C [Labilithrix luteola]
MDKAQIRHVAELAELSLSEDEEQRLTGEVGRILAYVAELDAIDTTDVPPTAHVAGTEPLRSGQGWRADENVPCLSHEDALAQAPQAEHEGFGVPGFVE